MTVNHAGAKLFGRAAADLVGCPVSMVLDTCQGRAADGAAFPVALTIGDLPKRPETILIVRDLRPEREREQRLGALQADLPRMARVCAIGEMGATLAHELNQPLTALLLYAQALERVLEENADVGASLARRIAAETERAAAAVALHVVDNGPRIASEDLPHLFTASGSSNTAGGGLGLAMSKAIAQNHGGDLTVDPGGRGRGACFTLHLPIPEARA